MAKKVYISVTQFAKDVGVSRQNILEYISNGKLTAFKKKGKLYKLHEKDAKAEFTAIGGGIKKQHKATIVDKEKEEPADNSDMKYGEALRREKMFSAEKKELEVKELKGLLVRKKKVYSELFAVGVEIRSAMLSIPDKTIDNILAADNRAEAHSILTAAITEALQSLSFKNVKI